MPKLPNVAVSAPGKVLLAGGYLVLDRLYTGLVFGLSARVNVIAGEIHTSSGVQLTEIVVDSPQFLDAQWRYGYHRAPEDGGIKVTQLARYTGLDCIPVMSRWLTSYSGAKISKNPFVETTLSFVLSYIDRVWANAADQSMASTRLIILADNDYYSQPELTTDMSASGRFAKFNVPLSGANKTGLGSSAALVTALTASLLVHYLPVKSFDIASGKGKQTLHNLAQAAHCAAQGKVGSGFDVAAAVFGSCQYRRFSPSVLSVLPEPGAPGFSEKLTSLVDDESTWDTEVRKTGVDMPSGVTLMMCDVDCGSQTVGMVKKLLSWRSQQPEKANQLWDDLQRKNEELGTTLRDGKLDELTAKLDAVRKLIREMSELSDVPVEPLSQTELLDALTGVEGVYGGVVPGAGGYDALAILMKDDAGTRKRVDEFLSAWSRDHESKVKLLAVKGETEGARQEEIDVYKGWL